MRAMAARGLVPLRPADLVTLLTQLSADSDAAVAATANETLTKLPDAVLLPACSLPLLPSVLDHIAAVRSSHHLALAEIAANSATHDMTVASIARGADEALCERIASNEQRLLGAPNIIAALYHNKAMRMSTADRIVELAARNGIRVEGVAAFDQHVKAIEGQLIPEPTEEPLPSDQLFNQSLKDDKDDPEAVEQDPVDGKESVKEQFKPLATRIGNMSTSEKVRLATIGNAAARAILVRDNNRLVATAAVSSPMMTDVEAVAMARSKEVSEDVLRYIGNKRDWHRNYELKRALIFNPKVPIGIALKFLSHMRLNDLKDLARSRNVPAPIKAASLQQIAKRDKNA
jgi:hypothetical protein